jgi:hypothetical protein
MPVGRQTTTAAPATATSRRHPGAHEERIERAARFEAPAPRTMTVYPRLAQNRPMASAEGYS